MIVGVQGIDGSIWLPLELIPQQNELLCCDLVAVGP